LFNLFKRILSRLQEGIGLDDFCQDRQARRLGIPKTVNVAVTNESMGHADSIVRTDFSPAIPTAHAGKTVVR